MEQGKRKDIAEFHSLMAAIRKESDLLKEGMLSKKEDEEISKIFDEFDIASQIQAFSTMNHLVMYQLSLWRELADG